MEYGYIKFETRERQKGGKEKVVCNENVENPVKTIKLIYLLDLAGKSFILRSSTLVCLPYL